MNPLHTLRFDNRYRALPGSLHADVTPQPLAAPRTLAARSDDCLALIGLPPDEVSDTALLEAFSGERLLPGMAPLAQKYTGHQFGVYNPDLGDGRGLLLGEVVLPDGSRRDLHLKGAGKTPFSRMGDGRAVLRSSIREFLASEALAALGISTTRALCVIGSDEPVYRETRETGAMLLRVARTHVRFGHFEYLHHSDQLDVLPQLLDYVIDLHLPALRDAENPARELFRTVVHRTAHMIAGWQNAGFAHGVMNSDNMSILGETFDYGPYGFLDAFEPGFICNHSDWQGRYAFNRQPEIGLWNLNCLAHGFSTLMRREHLVDALKEYEDAFHNQYLALLRARLGLAQPHPQDAELIGDLLGLMSADRADYTRSFRGLCEFDRHSLATPAQDEFRDTVAFRNWSKRYADRLAQEDSQDDARAAAMRAANPKYVLRNYLAETAIRQAQAGDFSEVMRLHRLLRTPFAEQPAMQDYAALPPDWGRHLEISCSS
ncbi:hypothetical protein S7S_07365 [Isoalcanivorax pacificus W11-5]|uniref:Protein nucleotidyltransferase YdiU n=2 Tax=Isoalcanivorax TaxID=3020833 RepID=A0A0B4XI85_9GAMM|nr:hypothetical protein S7S_07365 [Isoalcanivorax pacificus W11-5]